MSEPEQYPQPVATPDQLQLIFQEWQAGNQQGALDRLREPADRGVAWAASLYAWLLMQQGVPQWPAAVPYAKRAQQAGMPWAATQLFNNMVGNVQSQPDLIEPMFDLLASAPFFGVGTDPVAQAWNLVAQSRPDLAARLLGVTAPYPANAEAWNALVAHAQSQVHEMNAVVASARDLQKEVSAQAGQAVD